uniref:Sulfotransferase n=1 Tax=Capra hircus TaxID=9925 RepID=A0A8C2NAQ4_CAPHI
MSCFEEEGSWSLSFAGAGFLSLYHVGVIHCLRQRAPRLLRGASRFYGSSSGALIAVSIVSGMSVDLCCSRILAMVKRVEQLSLGVFQPSFMPVETVRQGLQDSLPADIHILASQRLGISLTHWPNGENFIVTNFATRDEVIERYINGTLSNNIPFADSPSTITVSPFHGTADICPQSSSASTHELNVFNANFQISTENFFLGISSLMPSSPEVVADSCRQGYLDALRFLERRGLTEEPVLWSFVSKEPPAPADGTPGAAHDRGLSLNWAVPNVLVKDVPDFEQLSPELEAALKKACTRAPSTWASFCRSGPGRALTYLLLPCTLPFEYVYVQSRRASPLCPLESMTLRAWWSPSSSWPMGIVPRPLVPLQIGGMAAGHAGRLVVDARLAEELGPRGLFQDEGPAPQVGQFCEDILKPPESELMLSLHFSSTVYTWPMSPLPDCECLNPGEEAEREGTSLLQEVVYLVSQGADPDEIGLMNIDEQLPVLEYPQPGLDIIKELTSPRLIKSHLPYRFLPSDLHNGDSKVIYMARNPKDLVVSYYQFHRSLRTMSYRGTFQEFCRRFMNDKLGYGSWFEHVQEFWEHHMDSNVLFLK